MTPDEARVKALELAVEYTRIVDAMQDVVDMAEKFRQFLLGPGTSVATPPYPGPPVTPYLYSGSLSSGSIVIGSAPVMPQPTQQLDSALPQPAPGDISDLTEPVASRREWYHP